MGTHVDVKKLEKSKWVRGWFDEPFIPPSLQLKGTESFIPRRSHTCSLGKKLKRRSLLFNSFTSLCGCPWFQLDTPFRSAATRLLIYQHLQRAQLGIALPCMTILSDRATPCQQQLHAINTL
eukprot:6456129-Amphidinium_carterae.2